MSQRIAGVKGMNDLLPPDTAVWHFLEGRARETFRRFGYEEIRTPVVEDTALFVRGVGEATDIVGKEMYTFEDRAGRSLSLRPENTAPAVRAYIEHAVHVREPLTRWYYVGPMFRYERMKTGRYRQFWQMGAEAYGSAEPAQDAEVIDLGLQFFEALGLNAIRLELNSLGDATCRPAYLDSLVAYFRAHHDELCEECRERLDRKGGRDERQAEPERIDRQQAGTFRHRRLGGRDRQDGGQDRPDAGRPAGRESKPHHIGAPQADRLLHLEPPLPVQQADRRDAEEVQPHHDDGDPRHGRELVRVEAHQRPDRARARAQRHEHGGEARHEQERGHDGLAPHPPLRLGVRQPLERGAGQINQVRRHQRQYARRQEGHQSGQESSNRKRKTTHSGLLYL